jgi:glutamyl-tRNA synthetase
MTTDKIRTRFAPSPTGYMHVGNLRTALYAWLLAKSSGGTFILRIEDTDQEREVEGAVDLIYRTLKETGLEHDEGPDKEGNCGPYIQSARKKEGIYEKHINMLIENGSAYRCFCDKERLEKVRTESLKTNPQSKYDRFCLSLSKEEIKNKIDDGVPYVVRQKMPSEGSTSFYDEVFGEITVENSTLDDIILMKSDGYPTYNFANVVDDHLMEITHVVRGSEYLISTPKYNLLYKAFGWTPPKYVHVSPVMRDAQRKLSKRDGDASYNDFLKKGVLKEALLNYIALLGWNAGNDQEKFTLKELVDYFDIKGISKSPAIFDETKLRWLNGEYIREMDHEIFKKIAEPYIRKVVKREDIDIDTLVSVLQKRTELLSDIAEQIDFIDELPQYDPELYVHKKMKTDKEKCLTALEAMIPVLENFNSWGHTELYEKIIGFSEESGINKKAALWSLRVALSGKMTTPGGGTDIAAIIGRKESISRMQKGVELLRNSI